MKQKIESKDRTLLGAEGFGYFPLRVLLTRIKDRQRFTVFFWRPSAGYIVMV